MCRLTHPSNKPSKDIARKLSVQSDLFLIGCVQEKLIASVMAGYDGHCGWINYLAIDTDFQSRGYGKQLVLYVEKKLRVLGCPKINLQIREGNDKVFPFYQNLGFVEDNRVSMGKGLKTTSDFNPIQSQKILNFDKLCLNF